MPNASNVLVRKSITIEGLREMKPFFEPPLFKATVRAGLIRASEQAELEIGLVAHERIYSLPENHYHRTNKYWDSLFKGGRFHIRRLLGMSFHIGTSIPYAGFLETGTKHMSARKIFATAVERGIDRIQGAFWEGFNRVWF